MGRSNRHRKFYAAGVEAVIAYAEHEFRNARRLDDGGTEKEHKAAGSAIWRKLGRAEMAEKVDPANPHECPQAFVYLWDWFVDICPGLASNGMGIPVVTWEALKAWSDAMGVDLDPWERRALVRLGSARAAILSETKPKPTDGHQHQDRPG